MRLQILLTVASVALSVTAHAADATSQPEQYLCVVDQSTGFKYNSQLKTWDATNFTADKKYILSVSRKPGDAFKITQVGSKFPVGFCKQGFNESELLFCDMISTGEFKFNRVNGRFLLSHPFGYYNVGSSKHFQAEEGNTPYLSIGKCSPI